MDPYMFGVTLDLSETTEADTQIIHQSEILECDTQISDSIEVEKLLSADSTDLADVQTYSNELSNQSGSILQADSSPLPEDSVSLLQDTSVMDLNVSGVTLDSTETREVDSQIICQSQILECDSQRRDSIKVVELELSESNDIADLQPYSNEMLNECVIILNSMLPAHWRAMFDNGVHVMKFSSGNARLVQRSLFLGNDKKLTAQFHGKELPPDHCYYKEVQKIDFNVGSAQLLANLMSQAVSQYRLFEVCCGVPSIKFKSLWHRDKDCFIDLNPFQEIRYANMTCRSNSCSYSVPQLQRQCKNCNKVQKRFSSRAVFRTAVSPSKPKTPNKFKPYSTLITPEKKKKRVELYQKRQNSRLREIIAKTVAEESVLVDEEFDRDLTLWIQEADQDNKVLDFHKIFLQQQLQASNLKDKRGMRWHPLMIRFALLVKSISDSAYSAMAQSGFIHLPCQKTLYDYSHAMNVYEGCHPEIIEDVAKVVNASEHPYQKNHVLSFDEVTVSQNLVTRKDTGEVIGYCKLDMVKSQMLELKKIKDTTEEAPATAVKELHMVKKMLSFMIRGVANGVQSVVASYGVSLLSKEDLHVYVWEVVGCLEMCGLKICAFICDGSSINRSFYEMQQPATVLSESKIVLDTPNIYDPDRKIYFISDPPHLLKTIRNCLYNSGRKKCRELKKNGETLKWSTIVQLYKLKSTQTVKKLFKLTAPCVFLNSWSRMKVALAARVLSQSVANVLKSLNREGTSELCIFDEM